MAKALKNIVFARAYVNLRVVVALFQQIKEELDEILHKNKQLPKGSQKSGEKRVAI